MIPFAYIALPIEYDHVCENQNTYFLNYGYRKFLQFMDLCFLQQVTDILSISISVK